MKCRYIEPEPDIDVSSGHIYTYTNKPVCSYAPHQVESLSFFIIIIVFVSVEKNSARVGFTKLLRFPGHHI